MEAEPQLNVAQNNKQEKPHKKGEQREKGEIRQKRPRPERKNEYDYNPDLIDQNTVIPPLPKKGQLIPKPDINIIKDKEAKNNARIEEIIEKKKAIRAEKFKFNRRAGEKGDGKHSEFQSEISEVEQLRKRFQDLKTERNKLRDKLGQLITEAKANQEKLKQYRGSLQGSRENFSEKLDRLEHRLLTATISKQEQKSLNAEIMLLKRKIRQAQSSGDIQYKLEQCEELKEKLDAQIELVKKEKDPLEIECNKAWEELQKKNEKITGLKGQLNAEKTQKTEEKQRHDKEYEQWKVKKQERLEKLETDIAKLKEDNKKLWEEYHKKQQDYWKQKQLVDFIEWQTRIKNKKINNKERESRKAEYEKRDKEREKEDQLKKYLGQIELINFLINYLNSLRAEDTKALEKKESKLTQAELAAKLSADNQWKKLEVIKSKKSQEDEEPERKHGKKYKKKNQQTKQEQKFNIPFNVQNMFESLHLLAPSSPEAIDAKIKELRDREELFVRVSNGQPSEEDKKLADDIKNRQSKRQVQKASKKEQEEFPTI